MKFALIKERKTPPDRRVVFSPEACQKVIQDFPKAQICVESSDIRVFSDEAYAKLGLKVTEDVSECDVLLGVKEVPIDALIPNKSYFFFSHTIKKQPYNRDLLRAILNKNITLYDHEAITNPDGHRLIGFGYYAGIVGAYNGLRAYGLKYNTFTLPKVEHLKDKTALNIELDKVKQAILDSKLKIVLTGTGKVGKGAKEILDYLNIDAVTPLDYVSKSYNITVYTQIDVLDYNSRKDGQIFDKHDFYKHPEDYNSTFMKFAQVSNFFIAGHYHNELAPYLYTRKDAKSDNFNIRVVADISCDIDGPVASTIRASTIANPIYGYDPKTESEVDFKDENAIVVMAVDNLPCELPDNASRGFGFMFLQQVIPAFFNGDKDGVLARAKITENGKLTSNFAYLQDYVDGF